MLNQIVMVGRLVEEPTKKEKDGKVLGVITLAVPRSFKNKEGEYETDFIPCELYSGIATNVTEYCRKGDLIGIKGRIANLGGEGIKIVAEKVTFLSSKPKEEAK